MPPDATAVNEKKWPCPGDYFAKNAFCFLRKMRFFALFALDFPHLGFHFGAPKAAQYKGISEIPF